MIDRRESTGHGTGAQGAFMRTLLCMVVLASSAASQAVRGIVVDATTQAPLPGAIIQIDAARSSRPKRLTTDTLGAFSATLASAGLYTITATKLGYAQHNGDTVRIGESETVTLNIQLDRAAVPLRPITVTERVSGLPDGFEERRAAGFGRFLTRSDIESRRGSNTSDLLRGLPGLVLTPVRRGRGNGNTIQMRGTAGLCAPAVWIDGLPVTDGALIVDDLLSPTVLEAVEVYNSTSNAPIQYRTGNCGVVLFWTRRGEDGDRARIRWWKLAFGAAAGVGLVLLLRR